MISYHTFIPLAGDELTRLFHGVSIVDRIPFLNIPTSAGNICLQLKAGVMWFGSFAKSNTIMFPRAQLMEAWAANPETVTQKPN